MNYSDLLSRLNVTLLQMRSEELQAERIIVCWRLHGIEQQDCTRFAQTD